MGRAQGQVDSSRTLPARGTSGAHLQVALPGREQGFRQVRGEHGTLILPTDGKQVWQIDERIFRSLIVDDEGHIISSGFPKFANLNERGFTDHLEDLRATLKNGHDVWLTSKVDGSLIIRSVVAGKILWRTRGAWNLGQFEKPVMAQVSRHPELLDPKFMSTHSLLFEFVSSDPQLRIVLAHPEDGLVFLGAVRHHDASLMYKDEMAQVAGRAGVSMVESVVLPGGLKGWQKEVKAWTGREGVVIRLPKGQMLKLKSSSYLELHRLKTNFSLRAVKRMIFANELRSVEDFEAHLYKQGADWEIISGVEPLIQSAMKARAYSAKRFPMLLDEVDMLCIKHPGKKDAQLQEVNSLPEAERQAGLLILDGRIGDAEQALERAALQEALVPFDDPREDALSDE